MREKALSGRIRTSACQGDDAPVTALGNLGPVSARGLAEAGIYTVGDLRAIGAAEAFRRIAFIQGRQPSLNLLYALHGALLGLPWRLITAEMREGWKQDILLP